MFINHITSPNHDARRGEAAIDMLVLHYTGMKDFDTALGRLTDYDAKVSAHYLINEDGAIYSLVPEDRRAWHAGVSSWHGNTDINSCSIGIELVNPGHENGYRGFTTAQMEACYSLSTDIVLRHNIPSERVLGHSDVAPGRRRDPGELFDWTDMAMHGIGIWPERFNEPYPYHQNLDVGSSGPDVCDIQKNLATFGYKIQVNGKYDINTKHVVMAFQRHFRPSLINGSVDAATRHRLSVLLGEQY